MFGELVFRVYVHIDVAWLEPILVLRLFTKQDIGDLLNIYIWFSLAKTDIFVQLNQRAYLPTTTKHKFCEIWGVI